MNSKSGGFRELIRHALEIIRDMTGCSRLCFIAKENGEFVMTANIPENQRDIGMALDKDFGKDFLVQVMDKRKMVFVGHAKDDSRLCYMRGLINVYNIESILFAPLYYKDINIGIIVVDAVGCQEKNILDMNLRKVKEFVKFCAEAIGREIEIQKNDAKILEIVKESEAFCVLGRHTAGIAHTFRNSMVSIGGFAQRLIEVLGKKASLFEKYPESKKLFNDVSDKMKIIDREVRKLERFIKDILIYSKIQNCVKTDKKNINGILLDELRVARERHKDVKFLGKFDKRLDKIMVLIDSALFTSAMDDIISNAIQAKASTLLIKTELDSGAGICRIIIANNGEKISEENLKEIFSPFFTTKPYGTGLGLPNVSAIVAAHGGTLKVESADSNNHDKNHNNFFATKFEISLPLKNSFMY